jgi:hypothetical protein
VTEQGGTNEEEPMAEQISLPYVPSYGAITKVLKKIMTAATPDRFTYDFLSTKLGMSGGSARALVPFLKRIGFLDKNGAPTDLYKRYRNQSQSGAAVAEAMRTGYKTLYEMNEQAHQLEEQDLKGLIVQATGSEAESSTVKFTLGSFKMLKQAADFESPPAEKPEGEAEPDEEEHAVPVEPKLETRLGLSYTINLNLPPTSDIAVFNAIFKSLREHLLR